MKKHKADKTLKDFIKYAKANPEQRFWQLVRNWSKADFILYKKDDLTVDTFYCKSKDKI